MSAPEFPLHCIVQQNGEIKAFVKIIVTASTFLRATGCYEEEETDASIFAPPISFIGGGGGFWLRRV